MCTQVLRLAPLRNLSTSSAHSLSSHCLRHGGPRPSGADSGRHSTERLSRGQRWQEEAAGWEDNPNVSESVFQCRLIPTLCYLNHFYCSSLRGCCCLHLPTPQHHAFVPTGARTLSDEGLSVQGTTERGGNSLL